MRKLLIYIILSFFPSYLKGQQPDTIALQDTVLSRTLSEIVITANRFGSVGINTPEAIKVADELSIRENQLRTVPEALSITPGVFVQKTNHGGGSPFVRGLTGNQTLLLLDGVRLSNSTTRYGPNQYFNTIDVFSIEKMEVLRGSGSVQYGSDAIGGTIQAFSHQLRTTDESLWGSSLLTRFATHGMEQSIRGGVNYSNNRIALRSGITWRNFGDIIGGDTTGKQSPTGYREFDYDLKGKINLTEKTSGTVLYQDVNQINVPVYHKVALEDYKINKMDPQKRKLAYLRVDQEMGTGLFKSLSATASYQNTRETREIQKNESSTLRIENDKVRSLGISAEAVLETPEIWSGIIGIEVYNDLVNSTRTDITSGNSTEKRGLYPDGSAMTSMAGFTVNSFDLGNWIVTAGARFNTYVIKVDDEALGLTKLTPSALVGNLALLRKLSSTSNLFASLNTGFRAPNIDDLGTLGIVDFRYETPNLDLKPESSVQYQIGYKYLDRKVRGEVYIYRNQLYNLITRSRVGEQYIEEYPVYQKENSDKSYIQGVETSWDYDFSNSWSFHGDITYTYGQNITKNEPVRRIPPLFGRIAAEYNQGSWLVNVEWLAAAKQSRLAQGDKDDNRIPEGGTPGWSVFNINSSYTWKFITVDLSLRNILNADYRYHGSGVNGYGRSLLLTVGVEI
ncbi:MAG TPA: TonB-dependent receptor [Bacteroidales bacterium]|nr:TonB-dependent receptor [Bacteroidales bacterium]